MILSDFRGPGAHFGSLGTHFQDVSDIVILALSRRSLFAGLDQEYVLMRSLSRFMRYCTFFEAPSLAHCGTSCGKKTV